ncbi:SusC/RagA family TonB-linked outer membrane protein [Sphingobacterium faecale]|uniref:SusC/RagA family TonB-linked outer membrane protein n=1 Tax=Sphingobacterium faecale TaxID=2803775 RepID=A0ABS1R9V1_9SPHI|nr:SusC/RagA family TonB-linked outer membrane protein [Sphingobacterium faecale]MBL1410994.1 SusC/RagA family TonB-linked outer membrane protein [Sphingobacterium faecale]
MNNNHDAACMMHLSNETIRYWIMRIQLITLFIVLLLGQLNASSSYGQKVTIEAKRQSLERVLKEIKKQSGFDLIYNPSVFDKLAESVTVSSSHTDLQYVLSDIFKKQSKLEFLLNGKTIIVRPRGASKQDVEESTLSVQQPIRGRVTNEKGEPLAGASIYVLDGNKQRTSKQTNTDTNGNFELKDVAEGQLIEISYLGHRSLQRHAKAQMGTIVLPLINAEVEEIVVNAGYYTVKDRERTGSIARVTAKDIEFQPVINPLQAIQGRMAGVSITQKSGIPGAGFDIQIRGRNSLRTKTPTQEDGNTPLYIVDGVPISAVSVGDYSFTQINPGGDINPLSAINHTDIESIEILKDADATAIYGSRGANGVVLITTKRGVSGKTKFTVTSSYAGSKIARKMKLMNLGEYMEMREEFKANTGITYMDIDGTWDVTRETDWQDELIGGTAISKNLGMSVSGGNEYTSFLISANRNNETTVYPISDGYKRNNLSTNISHKSKDERFQLTSTVSYSVQKSDFINTDLTREAIVLPPNAPSLYNSDGTLNWTDYSSNRVNPLASSEATYHSNNRNLVLNGTLSYNLIDNIFLKLNAGITNTAFEESRYEPNTMYNPVLVRYQSPNSSTSAKARNDAYSYLVEPQVTWNKSFGIQRLEALVGGTYEERNNSTLKISGSGFTSNALITNIGAAKSKGISSVGGNPYKYAALFARLNYVYDSKYIVNITGRRDGSSRFGDNNKFGNFGALGGAWLFSKERFLQEQSWLTFGKLRASFGVTGSDNTGDYQYIDTYDLSTAVYDDIVGLLPSKLFNPDFGWEKTTKAEAAIELGLFNDRINTSIAYYNNRSSNQLVGIPLPATTGFPSISGNLPATVQNSGWELVVSSTNIKNKGFRWESSFNISANRNKLVSFPDLEGSTYANTYMVGKSTSISRRYKYLGIDQDSKAYKFQDFNNDGKITAAEDRKVILDLYPKFYGGVQNSLVFNKVSLDILLHFVKQKGANPLFGSASMGGPQNKPKEMTDRWTPDNPNAKYTITAFTPEIRESITFMEYSDRSVTDASFLRIKNISLAYQFKFPNLKVEALKLYVQGQNLWTFTNFMGLDPENLSSIVLPPLRTFSFGVQLIL